MPKIIIYTTLSCVYCCMAKAFFQENNVAYEEKDVLEDEKAREDMIAKSGQMGVPVIEIDDQIIIGFNKEKLKNLIGL